ncbi:hypothetical protein [Actinomadura gamaensis]|uniref:Secreted protein n=1 Tax=Actinomadura gamaensis TaxID=1763541 RepID=A0ABV9U8I9_9ACTN
MRSKKLWKAGTVGLATAASALTLGAVTTPAHAAAPSPTVHAQGAWHTFKNGHQSHKPTTSWHGSYYTRPNGVRIIQVNARCWGNDSTLKVRLRYSNSRVGIRTAKSGHWACDGRYRTVRIHNAGGELYWPDFHVDHKHTIEYWMQYYK